MRLTKGITLLELLIAISLGTLIVLASSAIYLSGWQMFRDAQYIAQAQRNAMVPMMHIVKNIQKSAFCQIPSMVAAELPDPTADIPILILWYYSDLPDFTLGPSVNAEYLYNSSQRQIKYFKGGNIVTIGTHISTSPIINLTHTDPIITTNGLVVTITLNSDDNRDLGDNPYTITSTAECRYGPVPPPVY